MKRTYILDVHDRVSGYIKEYSTKLEAQQEANNAYKRGCGIDTVTVIEVKEYANGKTIKEYIAW